MMSKDQKQYSKLLLYSTMAATEHAWLAGYEIANTNGSIDENPYLSGDIEFLQWENGWWDGFYKHSKIIDEPEHNPTIIKDIDKTTQEKKTGNQQFKKKTNLRFFKADDNSQQLSMI